MSKSNKHNHLYNAIEDTLIMLWKEGKVVRSTNPDTKTGEYYYITADKAKAATKSNPALGEYITYKKFQSQIN
jgi:YD repeat-containing protein